MKTAIILILFLSAFGGIGFLAYRAVNPDLEEARQKALEEVSTTEVITTDIEETIVTSAAVRPILETEVRSEINGRIVSILIEEGDRVTKDQPLVELDRDNLETRLEEAQRQLESERLRLQREERDYERLKILREENFANEVDYLNAKTDLELAKLQLSIRETRLTDAQKDLDRAIIRAPHDGVVIDLDLTEGRVINGVNSNSNGTLLMKVADLSRMYLEASVSELEVGELYLGKPATVAFDSLNGEVLNASVSQIAASARNQRNRRVFPVRFELDTAGKAVRPGISGDIEILVESVEDVVAVSISNVFFNEEDEPFVYKLSGDGFVIQKVELGVRDHKNIQVLEGLESGEEVARRRPKDELVSNSDGSETEEAS